MRELIVPLWYIPSFYGDIRLEAKGDCTVLTFEKLTPTEVNAMLHLRERAINGTKIIGAHRWVTDAESFPAPTSGGSGTISLTASVADVQRCLSRALKPGRAVVNAVRFSDGHIYETRGPETARPPGAPGGPFRAVEEPAKDAEPVAGVTIAEPVRGCPAPDFERAEARAAAVLRAFLSPDQIDDFLNSNAFVSTGRDTGHRYMLISRGAPQMLNRFGGRSLYDLDEKRSYCVHDWEVPSAEELLGMYIMLSIAGGERYMRDIPAN